MCEQFLYKTRERILVTIACWSQEETFFLDIVLTFLVLPLAGDSTHRHTLWEYCKYLIRYHYLHIINNIINAWTSWINITEYEIQLIQASKKYMPRNYIIWILSEKMSNEGSHSIFNCIQRLLAQDNHLRVYLWSCLYQQFYNHILIYF